MNTALLHLLHLVSPALPVGAYAYSQGLEYAIDSGWLKTQADLSDWLENVLSLGPGLLDAPVLVRCLDALQQQDDAGLAYWNHWILACRETNELLLEDQQLGVALQRLLVSLGVAAAAGPAFVGSLTPASVTAVGTGEGVSVIKPSFAAQFAVACHHWHITKIEAVQGFLWSWLENQVAAATKIVPLGQTQAQKILVHLMQNIPAVAERALTLSDDEMGISLPGVAMASAMHERQYSRLFRS